MGSGPVLVAIEYHLDLYPANDPRDGTRLVRLSADGPLQAADYRDVIGVGSGRAVLRATRSEAAFITPAGEQYVRVVRDDGSTELVVGGWWTNQVKYAAAVTNETQRLEVGGAATMAYLARAVMAPHTYINADGALAGLSGGQDPFDGLWRLYAQGSLAGGAFLGAALWRVMAEAQSYLASGTYTHKHADGEIYTDSHDNDRVRNALPDLVLGFDGFEDSDGNPWTLPSGEFSAQIGENVLEVVRRLMQSGLYVEMDPDTFELRAWEGNDHRRDRTGAAWGASVVRLQAPTDGTIATGNIKSDSERLISSHVRRTTIWSGGTSDEYGIADTPTGTPWEGFVASSAAEVAALDQLAAAQLAARDEAGDVLTARIKLGAVPTSGQYLPWEHVKLDDIVTVHTGTGEWDYDEATYPVGALRVHLRDGGDWDAWVDLGASYEAMAQRQFEVAATAAHSHPPNPRLCTVPVGVSATDILLGMHVYEEFTAGGSSPSGGYFSAVADGDDATERGLTAPHVSARFYYIDWLNVLDGLTTVPVVAGYRILQTALVGNTSASYQIAWSDDNVSFTVADTIAGDIDTGQVTFGSPLQHRYWRIWSTSGPNGWAVYTWSMYSGFDSTSPGHNEFSGTSGEAARCDHRHDVHRDTAPTTSENAAAGYKPGTLWARLDDLVTPTAIVGVWVLVDAAAGTWLALPFGVTDHGALTGLADDDHPQYTQKATLTTTGDLYYASGASTPARRAIGSTGDVLTVAGGVPTWAVPAPSLTCSPLTNGDASSPELIFADGDTIAVCV